MRRPFLTLLLILALAGCSRGPAPLSAQEVADRAAQTLAATSTLHFVIDKSGVDSPGLLGLRHAEGDLVAPDKVRATVKAKTLGMSTEIGVVAIGDRQWATNPLSKRWEPVPPEGGAFDLGALFDAEVGIGALLKSQQWKLETASGGAYSLSSTVDGARLTEMSSGMITKGNVDLRLLVDPQSFLVTDVTLVERDSSAEQPATWHILLSKPATPVEIVPPPGQ